MFSKNTACRICTRQASKAVLLSSQFQYPMIIVCSLYMSSVPPQMEHTPVLVLECDEDFESNKDRTKKLLKQVGE